MEALPLVTGIAEEEEVERERESAAVNPAVSQQEIDAAAILEAGGIKAKCLCSRPVVRFTVEDIPQVLFEHWRGHPRRAKGLPDKLRGVFWMADNPAPELCVCFEGVQVDEDRRSFVFDTPGGHNWAFCDRRAGWVLYYGLEITNCNIVFQFDEKWENATMRLRPLGCIPLPR